MLRKVVGITLVAMFSVVMTACSTVEGVGRDTEWIGEGIQDVAENTAP